MTGYIPHHIPCSGTLVAVNATGFCILTERTHQEVSLAILLNPKDDTQPVHLIKADCDFAKIHSVPGIDYSFGSVSHNDLNIPVTSDEVLTIGLSTRCTGRSCFFQPAVTSKHMEDGKPGNETEIFTNVSLLFTATIEVSNGKLFYLGV